MGRIRVLKEAFSAVFGDEGKVFEYDREEDGEMWYELHIGGLPQETYTCDCEYDCCGHVFCMAVYSYFGGFITIGRYGINV